MRIGIIISSFVNGGAQRVAVTLDQWISATEDECCIIALNDSEKNQYNDVGTNLIRLSKVYPGQNTIGRLRSFDREHSIDVYIVMGVPMCMYVMPALRGTRAKIIVSERNDPRNFQGKKITKVVSRWLMGRADGFVFQTNDASEFYRKYKDRSVVIPNPLAETPAVAVRTPNESRKREIVTAGRLVPQKNHEMLIRAFAEMEPQFPEYRLVIYGQGELREKLTGVCHELGVQDKVVFPGAVNDLHQRIIDSELFVLSSNFEGMPNALMEAMAMGMTCISTDCPCGGPKDFIEHGKNGLLFPVGDQAACVKAMTMALTDKEQANRMGQNALAIREKYAKERICRKWLEKIHSVVG